MKVGCMEGINVGLLDTLGDSEGCNVGPPDKVGLVLGCLEGFAERVGRNEGCEDTLGIAVGLGDGGTVGCFVVGWAVGRRDGEVVGESFSVHKNLSPLLIQISFKGQSELWRHSQTDW